MSRLDRGAFERHLRGLPGAEFAHFVADLWAARGWETRIEGDTVVATRGGTERTLLVRHDERWLGWLTRASDPGRERGGTDVDAVVTRGRRGADSPDADLYTAGELYEQFVYGLDAGARRRLRETYFAGRPPPTAWLSPGELERAVGGVREAIRTPRGAITAALAVGVLSLVLAGVLGAPAYFGGDSLDAVPTPRPVVPSPTATPTPSPTAMATSTAGGATTGTPARMPTLARPPPPSEPWIGSGEDAWRMFRGGPAGTGWRPNATGPADGTILATFGTGGSVLASPAVVDGTVYIGSTGRLGVARTEGVLYALDAASLAPRWREPLGESVGTSPAVVDGAVYVGSVTWQPTDAGGFEALVDVHAVNATTARQRWQIRAGSTPVSDPTPTVTSSPTVVNGTLYVGGAGGGVHALDADTGERRWVVRTNGTVFASPAVANDTVYVGSTGGAFYAIDATDGSVRWTVPADGGIIASAAVTDGRVYVASVDGRVFALDARTGAEAWNRSFGSGIIASPAVANGTVYVGTFDGDLYAIAAADGTVDWNATLGGSVFSSPTVGGGTAYVGSTDGSIHALDAATGERRWLVRTDGRVLSSPAVANGVVYVGTTNGTVYAIGEPTRDG